MSCSRPSAAAQPNAIAVSGPDETLTYGQLERRANQLAHRLRALGVDRDQLVGLCLERSVALVVGALGILKAGCAYVALDPSHPRERLAFMLGDSRAKVLVTNGQMATQLEDVEATVVALDAGRADARPRADNGAGGQRTRRRPRIRDLHLGLDGRSEGRRWSSTQACAT